MLLAPPYTMENTIKYNKELLMLGIRKSVDVRRAVGMAKYDDGLLQELAEMMTNYPDEAKSRKLFYLLDKYHRYL